MAATSLSSVAAGLRIAERYAALGDSFTAGAEPSPFDGGEPPAPRWPDAVADRLRTVNPRLDYRNLAVAGAFSTEVAGGQLDAALAFRPDVVTVLCGANDVLLAVRPDIGAHAAALSAIFGRLRKELPGTAVVTATTPDFSPFIPYRPRSRARVAQGLHALNDATESIARRHGVLCLDFAGHGGASDRDNFHADGVHPSAAGSERSARAVLDALERRLGVRTHPDPEERR